MLNGAPLLDIHHIIRFTTCSKDSSLVDSTLKLGKQTTKLKFVLCILKVTNKPAVESGSPHLRKVRCAAHEIEEGTLDDYDDSVDDPIPSPRTLGHPRKVHGYFTGTTEGRQRNKDHRVPSSNPEYMVPEETSGLLDPRAPRYPQAVASNLAEKDNQHNLSYRYNQKNPIQRPVSRKPLPDTVESEARIEPMPFKNRYNTYTPQPNRPASSTRPEYSTEAPDAQAQPQPAYVTRNIPYPRVRSYYNPRIQL